MAHDEDDFRIRPGQVRDRGDARRIGVRARPTSFIGEVYQAIRGALAATPIACRDREGKRAVQRAGPGRLRRRRPSRAGARGAGTGAVRARGRGGWR